MRQKVPLNRQHAASWNPGQLFSNRSELAGQCPKTCNSGIFACRLEQALKLWLALIHLAGRCLWCVGTEDHAYTVKCPLVGQGWLVRLIEGSLGRARSFHAPP